MVLGTAFDLSVLSYPVLVIMKEQGANVGRGGACPRTSGEAEPALGRRARRSLPSAVGQGGASPRPSGEVEPALRHRARQSQPSAIGQGRACPRTSSEAKPALSHRARRNQSSVVRAISVVAFLSDRKRRCSMVINSTSLDTPVLDPQH